EAVHGVRKRLKKVRALLKLLRNGLGKKLSKRENLRLRDAARPLTEIRDAQALLESLDALELRYGDELGGADALEPVRQALRKGADDIRDKVLADDGPLPGVIESIEESRRGLKSCRFRKGGWSALKAGLRRTYRQGLDGHDLAVAELSVENLHE